ncbi:MAG TPA: SAM-dependent methyltransferase [Chthoniobacterales bacterium]|nr:SAM-dependent methyltransferase [Chthoniobacterales bacterium]
MQASWLAEVVRSEGGRVSFERFMELALYHPVHGYYTGQVSSLGRRGDFSTAVTISDSLVRSIAAWVKAEAKEFSMPVTQIIELGGGNGRLAAGIIRSFRPWEPVRYQIVEISKTLRQTQEQELRGRRVRWAESVEIALTNAAGTAILISNEFVDAFPCRRFELVAGGWQEIILVLQDNLWTEERVESAGRPQSSTFGVHFGDGQRIETFQSYRNWLRNLDRHFRKVSMLTIDYGGSPNEIYHRRPAGTMRAFFRHQRIDGMEIYLRPGRQDLTADVNFSDLRIWGEELGLETIQLITQAEFIHRWSKPKSKTEKLADQFVADQSGMGSAFKVLHQRRG